MEPFFKSEFAQLHLLFKPGLLQPDFLASWYYWKVLGIFWYIVNSIIMTDKWKQSLFKKWDVKKHFTVMSVDFA